MADTIKVLIVDDLPETRENVRKLLQFESDIEVIGQAGTGEQAIEMAGEHKPDIILMDINMPGIDGIGASQKITELVPGAQIIIMSVQSDPDYLRRAMLAGARDFLTKPFGGDELVAAVRRVHKKRPPVITAPGVGGREAPAGTSDSLPSVREGNIIVVFSPKGGSGCSTIAINLAVALAKSKQKTLLIDASLQFGDVSVMLNMRPETSIVDVIERASEMDTELISSVVRLHRSGLNVLLAPPRPEMADVVTEQYVKKMLEVLRQMYDYIIIDTSSSLNDVTLTMLDIADRIILVAQQSLPSLKNASRFFDLTETLDYPSQKIWLVVNRVFSKQGISVKDIGNALKRPVVMAIPGDDVAANTAADQGVPVVSSSGRQPISVAFNKLTKHVLSELGEGEKAKEQGAAEQAESSGIFGRLFGRRVKAGG